VGQDHGVELALQPVDLFFQIELRQGGDGFSLRFGNRDLVESSRSI
jgi:hypothetical protein